MFSFIILFILLPWVYVISHNVPPVSEFECQRTENLLSSAVPSSKMSVYFLPDSTKPLEYDLHIWADLEKLQFNGTVSIKMTSEPSTKDIFLNSKDLDILLVTLEDANSGQMYSIEYHDDTENQMLQIKLINEEESLTSSKLQIQYSGKIRDDMRGFYKSTYKINGVTQVMAVTQFESVFARMAFPCFDEPRFKTPFTIKITHNKNFTALSNMPISASQDDTNFITDTFQKSPPMPTYLVAFSVSQFLSLENEGKKFAVWARENAIDDAKYALEIGPKLLDHLEIYTTIPYALPKMDFLAVPDMDFGAMENWGLVVYREQAMLYNKHLNTESNKARVTKVISHELAHQWFGNYITPNKWDYIWLNEAFATYFEDKIISLIEPSWRNDELFLVDTMQSVMNSDGIHSHYGMTRVTRTPEEINGLFDAITYHKGASILRMLEYMVSPYVFKKAIQNYLKTNYKKGGSVKPSDLWRAFEEELAAVDNPLAINNTFTIIMEKWTTQAGYPLVKVFVHDKSTCVSQHVYDAVERGNKPIANEFLNQTWYIPITYTTKTEANFNNVKPAKWLKPGEHIHLNHGKALSNDWIIVNLQEAGYYRVNYDIDNWNLLIDQLLTDPAAIHVLNRAQLIDDSFTLALDNKLSYRIPLTLIKYMTKESDLLAWLPALSHIQSLFVKFWDTSVDEMLQELFVPLLESQFNRVGFHETENDDHVTKIVRSAIVSQACKYELEHCVQHAKEEYNTHIANLSSIPNNVKPVVFCTVLASSKVYQAWERLWKLYNATNSAHEKEIILTAFGCMKSSHHFQKYLHKLIDPHDNNIREQDKIYAYRAIVSSGHGVTATLKFVKKNLDNITTMPNKSINELKYLISISSFRITSSKQLKILEHINYEAKKLTKKKYEDFKVTVASSLKASSQRVEGHERIRENIRSVLQEINAAHTFVPSVLMVVLVSWVSYMV